jgi:hypothetical protein
MRFNFRGALGQFSVNESLGVALLADGRLLEGCGDGVIRVWEGSEIINQVSAFESSMAAAVR